MDNPDWELGKKVPEPKEGTPNGPGVRSVVMMVCLEVMVTGLQSRPVGGYNMLCLHDYLF